MTEDKYSLRNNTNIERAKTDRDYLGELLIQNENLIWYTIRKYIGDPYKLAQYNGMEKDDIQQVGRIGFIKAVDNFDSSKGVLFTTYAPSVILGEVKAYLREKGRLLRLTRSAYELNVKILDCLEDVYYDNYVPVNEIADELGEDTNKVQKVLSVGITPFRIHSRKYNIDENPPESITAFAPTPIVDHSIDVEDEIIEKMYLDYLLKTIRSKLTERDNRILDAKLEGKTHEQIAKNEDIAKITVTRTMNKIRKILKDTINK